MICLICFLSGIPDPAKVTHYIIPAGGGLADKQRMPPPQFLVIEATAESAPTGALLYCFDGKGECVGDTWHRTIEEAKKSATAEYAGLLQEWQAMPEGVDLTAFSQTLKAKH